jgi:lactoylglutathione lyase
VKISLLVIRCLDIEVSKNFYELLGFSFAKERHGNGLLHYTCEHEGSVFELYPNKGEPPKDNNRLGFKVSSLESILKNIKPIESYNLRATQFM